MKRIFKYMAVAAASLGVVSCDAIFDNMEGDLTKMTAEDMLGSEAGIIRLLANLYGYMPINAFSTADKATFYANNSRETLGYSAAGMGSSWNYTQMRSINKFIEALESAAEKGIISADQKDSYMGEAMFIRAYVYFGMVANYGGVPIVTKSLDNEYVGDGVNAGLYVERSTEKETWDWVIDQFGKAAELLPAVQKSGEMRVNKYTAYGMQARAALWAASESKYWDRAPINSAYPSVQKGLQKMEASYADAYYAKTIEAASKVIESGQYKLYGENPASVDAAVKNLEALFQTYQPSEGLLGRSYVSGSSTTGNGLESKNGGNWGAPHQVTQGYLGGKYSVTLNLVDEYDNYASETDRKSVDGTVKTKLNGDEATYFHNYPERNFKAGDNAQYVKYNSINDPFKLKDARFQAWVIYPGTTFRGEFIHMQGGLIKPDGTPVIYPTTNDPVVKGDVTYYPYGGQAEQNSAFFKLPADINSHNRTDYAFMCRKYLDTKAFNEYSQSPWYDLRYSEVLLAYAEANVESGKGDAAKAKKYLNDIRHRAGFTDDVDLTLDNILHEYKVEFAFESKYSAVLWRRRAFYTGGSTIYDHEGEFATKTTLLPVVDLSGDKAQYIFLRTLPMFAYHNNATFQINIKPEQYYSAIPNYINNHLINNNQN